MQHSTKIEKFIYAILLFYLTLKRRKSDKMEKSKKIAPLIVAIGVLILVLTVTATAATYYVAPTGDDSNSGTLNQPWRTIRHAADTMVAGDTVYIKAGTYNERVVPRNSGSVGNYITYTAYPGDTVTIDGEGISLPSEWVGLFD